MGLPTRRAFLMGLASTGGIALQGCSAPVTGGSESADPAGSEGNSNAGPVDLQVAWDTLLLYEGITTDDTEQPLSVLRSNSVFSASNMLAIGDRFYVGAGGTVFGFTPETGEVAHQFSVVDSDEEDPVGDIMSIAASQDVMYAATSGGYVVAFDVAPGAQLWATLCCSTRSPGITSWGGGETLYFSDAPWRCTSLAMDSTAIVVGYSSYQLENMSLLACVEASTGAVRWTRQLEGRLDTAGGIGYPVAVDAGLLLPMPDGSGLGLLSMQTGETLDLLETDSPIYMGLTMSDEGGLPCYFQSKLATLYKVDVENGALVAAIAQDACTDSVKRVPSGARPLLADGRVIVNAATQDEDAKRFDGDYNPSAGECVVFDAETLEVLERHDAPEIESTPVRMGEGMYYLGRAGIYYAALEGGVPGEPELVIDAEGRDRDIWEQQLLAADGMLYFVGGPYGERWLYAIGPADEV